MPYLAIDSTAKILKKGDILRDERNDTWTYQSTTHPRKVFVTAKDDPNGPDSWPNLTSREFYAGVFDLGIWDTRSETWTWKPDWNESDLSDLTHVLTKKDKEGQIMSSYAWIITEEY